MKPMKPWEWIPFSVGVAFVVLGLFVARRGWQNRLPMPYGDKAPPGYIFSDPVWRGNVRSGPIAVVGCLTGVLAVIALLLSPSFPGLRLVAIVLLATVFTTAMVFLLTVTFFNWPKFVVPRHLRGQPGAVQEWSEERRRRNHSVQKK